MKREEVNPQVKNALGQFIQSTMKTWNGFITQRPILYEDFNKWLIPKKNITNAGGCLTIDSYENPYLLNAKSVLKAKEIVNAAHYSPMSGMFWHTNNDNEGNRVYYTFSLDKAVFKYADPNTGEIREDWDDEGWTVRSFDINKDKPFWHCVWTAGRRFSFGFVR
tara:strand:- start:884 stop:1375 length:492 start_codon:yes stop_codon:yes gene_type:complete